MDVTPKSLVLDLLATLPVGGTHAMPVRALVEAGEIFGFAGNSIRVALARLLAQGRVSRDTRGRYRHDGVASALDAIRGWRQLDSRIGVWTRGWIGVQGLPGRSRGQRARDDQVLRLFGFRSLTSEFSVRPDNLRGGVDSVRHGLQGAGLSAAALVARLTELDSESEARLCELWDVAVLERDYQNTIRELFASRERLARTSVEQAMVETFRRGGSAIRQLVLDPLLPEEIASSGSRGLLVAALEEYDAFGRTCWASFMRRHAVLPKQPPMALRLAREMEVTSGLQ